MTRRDIPLSKMTTVRIGGNAKYVVYPDNALALDTLVRFLKKKGVPYKMLGKGSDLLCSDAEYNGVIIRLDRFMTDVLFEGNDVIAEAGASIIALATQSMKKSLSGLEFASGIPGTVGGAVFMNAGAYKSSMSRVVSEVLVYRMGRIEWIDNEACGFDYRNSIFQSHPEWIILAARLTLQQGDKKEIEELMENRRQRRLASQPLSQPSCGSVFRNPEGKNAWELIEGIGYRGHRIGGAMVSDKHCNFIVNADHASADDYLSLIHEIQAKVQEKYGIALRTEVEKFNWK